MIWADPLAVVEPAQSGELLPFARVQALIRQALRASLGRAGDGADGSAVSNGRVSAVVLTSCCIPQEDAQRIALGEIASRYALDPSQLDRVSSLSVSYVRAEGSASGGKWRFGVALQNQMSFGVEVTDGVVTRCEKYAAVDDLEEAYRLLCEQRGAFFKWSLEDKMAFADSLPEKLASAKERDTLLSSSVELEAIAAYGFCLPVAGALSQDEACAVASDAMAEAFGIAREDCAGVCYSFFRQEEEAYVWRVIFWDTGDAEHMIVVVDLRALTGEILTVRASGGTAGEAIPYIERL